MIQKTMAVGLTASIIGLTSTGCESKPTEQPVPVTAMAAASGKEELIKAALLKAGIKNPPLAVFDAGEDAWSVVIAPDGTGPNGEPPPGRPIPERVKVSKADFSVTKQPNPNLPRPGGGGGREVN